MHRVHCDARMLIFVIDISTVSMWDHYFDVVDTCGGRIVVADCSAALEFTLSSLFCWDSWRSPNINFELPANKRLDVLSLNSIEKKNQICCCLLSYALLFNVACAVEIMFVIVPALVNGAFQSIPVSPRALYSRTIYHRSRAEHNNTRETKTALHSPFATSAPPSPSFSPKITTSRCMHETGIHHLAIVALEPRSMKEVFAIISFASRTHFTQVE